MKKKDMDFILENYHREDLPILITIDEHNLVDNINYIERIVRGSEYYEIWRTFNKVYEFATLDIIREIDVRDHKKIAIEQHHHPYTLYDIVELVGLNIIKDKKVVIVGYGSQGHAHANNLKDSGGNVTVALRKESTSWAKAEAAGLKVQEVSDAVKDADMVMILMPDELQSATYKSEIEGNIKEGDTVKGWLNEENVVGIIKKMCTFTMEEPINIVDTIPH